MGRQRLTGHDQLVAGRQKGDPGLAAHRQPGVVEGRREGEIARAEPPARRQSHLAALEVEAGGADVGAGLDLTLEPYPITLDRRVFLQRDRVGPGRQGAAGEDAHGLAGSERDLEAAAGRRHADQPEGRHRHSVRSAARTA